MKSSLSLKSSYFLNISIRYYITRSLSLSLNWFNLSTCVKIIKIFIPFYLMSFKKNFIHDIYSNYILLTMFRTINTVLILFNDEEGFDYDLNNWFDGVVESLKHPNILLSIICNAFEYFWNTLLDFSSEPYPFTELSGLSSNYIPETAFFWSVYFNLVKPSIWYFLLFFISNFFTIVPGN